MLLENQVKNPFLQTYLEYVEETETPRIMHIWSALSGAGACMGRRVYLPFGFSDIFANLCVLLVGPPGVRKSTAINLMQKRLRKSTGIRFAPEDSSGQRQGLIIAMEGDKEDVSDEDAKLIEAANRLPDIDTMAKINLSQDPRDAHVMYAVASEFTSFIGQNAIEMVTFLNKVLDGEDYDYKTRSSQHTLDNPLLNIIGGTSPSSIQDAFPKAAIGHGFTSRIVFVYANRKYKKVPRPPRPDIRLERSVDKFLSTLFYHTDGEVSESEPARKMIDDVYENGVSSLNDARFVYYLERRQTHLIKTAMVLAVARGSMCIELEDIDEANLILEYTEKFMPDALGEYGMSPLANAKQKMLEFLIHARGPITIQMMWTMMHRDMKQIDFRNSLNDLAMGGKIMQINTNEGPGYVYCDKEQMEIDELIAE